METESKDNFDVESWAEEGIAEAQKENPEMFKDGETRPGEDEPSSEESKTPEQEKQSAPEETQKEEQQQEVDDSSISKLLNLGQGEEPQGQRVPVEDHIKLRKRAQAAEEKAAELERQIKEGKTQTEGDDTSGEEDDPLVGLESDELVRAVHVNKAIDARVNKAVSEIKQTIEQSQTQQEIQRQAIIAVESEKTFKAETNDYDDVTKKASTLGLLTDADRKAIFQDSNPAKKYYELSKAKITAAQENLKALGFVPANTPNIEPKQPGNEQPENQEREEFIEDDEILEEIY